jgi:hypothetical protein
MSTALLSTAFFAPIPYYSILKHYELNFIEANDYYIKQTWRNRFVIGTANGSLSLSIPIEGTQKAKTPIRDVRVSEHGNWRRSHWNSIESAYQSSPFFEYYQDDLRPFFEKKIPYLFDLNEAILEKMCELMAFEPTINKTAYYLKPEQLNKDTTDFRKELPIATSPTSSNTPYLPKPYYQVFERKYGFLPNLSIMDILFNMGPECILYL